MVFKVGDRVKCINNTGTSTMLQLGATYLVKQVTNNGRTIYLDNIKYYWRSLRFELLERVICSHMPSWF